MPEPSALSTGFAELEAGPTVRVRVWDLPTRLFHWALAVAVLVQVATGLNGAMEWHFRCGYVVLALLCFRLIWGFVGGHWSRFGRLFHPPSAYRAYLRGESPADHRVGHSPLGSLSVAAMLLMLVLQVVSGLISDDEIAAAGPLTRFVSNDTVSLASAWHAAAGAWVIPALLLMHLVAIVFYLLRRQVLVRPMLTGDKLLSFLAMPSRDTIATRLLALFIFAGCAGFAYWISTLRA
ncbi:cytochrome b/b6 domain-containing protein [Variovorax dokdonensis]|uniref:Cytochrome b/b6 domain-containing protein n=1 Tax=Variovorax dokdonensis TaxID=344883 RepID=A0ABT7NFZ8_9BURK|nr:cytochrome b/b6 domain-containing protein [Variovorax dokdonensis]MDM0046876.1 cytochrome b/b6 domain-containing protein [Variovorax dokdonensis]